jgi:hypothetical protein
LIALLLLLLLLLVEIKKGPFHVSHTQGQV